MYFFFCGCLTRLLFKFTQQCFRCCHPFPFLPSPSTVTLPHRVLFNTVHAGGGASQAYGSQAYRHSVMQGYLYQAFLRCYPQRELPRSLLSAVTPFIKPESRGTDLYVPSGGSGPDAVQEGPVGKAITKLEAPAQGRRGMY